MDWKTLSIAALAVNISLPVAAAEPTLDECKIAFADWAFGEAQIMNGFLRTKDELAVALNEEVLDRLGEAEAERIHLCLDILMDNDSEPENWPYRPEEEI